MAATAPAPTVIRKWIPNK
jgi:hypothetical protein